MATTPLDHESLFRAIMATIPSSILIVDTHLAVLMVNHNFLEKSRVTEESILGRKLHEIMPSAFQDTALDRQIRDVIATGKTLRRQRMTYRAPGVSLRVYSYSICPLLSLDRSRGAILVMDDVTDILQLAEDVRRMQSHLASIVECAADLIISTDPRGVIMTWNTAAATATGYGEAEAIGTRLADHIEEPQNVEAERCFREVGAFDDRKSFEWPMLCRDGNKIPVSWRLSRMIGTNGQVTGVVVVGRNLVEQRAMEAQMRQSEKLAALGLVIGGIAHEIRSPLGVSSAAAQLMRGRLASPALLEECIEKVIAGTDRASLVVESLLRFARPAPISETAKINVLDVLRNALMFATSEAAAGTTVEWKLPASEAPVWAQGVQNLLELVVINLIVNAFQAMPEGGRLTIGAWRDENDIVIEIGDSGRGIPEAHLGKIFDPFFTTKNDSRRSGLGLSVSHSIVRQHGGGLTVRTSASEGATFVVRIPAAQEPDRAANGTAGS